MLYNRPTSFETILKNYFQIVQNTFNDYSQIPSQNTFQKHFENRK